LSSVTVILRGDAEGHTDKHTERLALNQALFRAANERMSAWWENRQSEPGEPVTYYCECSRTGCRERLSLRPDEYEAVRVDSSRHFVVALGHEYTEFEHVISQRPDYAVVEKFEEVAAVVEATDSRALGLDRHATDA
jgi:hypothetical protein